jgi:hypothetical protein
MKLSYRFAPLMMTFQLACAPAPAADPDEESGGAGGTSVGPAGGAGGKKSGGSGGTRAMGGKGGIDGKAMGGAGGSSMTDPPDAGSAPDLAVSAPDVGAAETTAPAGGIEIAGKLHRYLRTLKCVRDNPQDTRRSCFCSDPDANRHDLVAIGGDPAVTYQIVLRIRGIVEPRGYTGGALQDPANPWLYVGGMPGGPNDNALYNQYKLLVAEPKQVYYLNANSAGILPRSSRDHDLHKLDYTAKLTVKGGSMVDVANEDRPSGMNRNFMQHKVDGVPPEILDQGANGFDGQFFYVEVESVTAMP